MTAVDETNLATKCLDLCQTLTSQGLVFKFSLTAGSNFSFTLDTRVMASVNQAKAKKKPSPSTIRRNARRREEFLMKKQNPAPVSSARPLQHLPSPPAASERRQVISVRRDGTMPSFSQLDGNVNLSPSPTSRPPGLTSSASTNTATLNPLAGSSCPAGTVEQNANYGDSPPSDAPPPPTCISCCGPTEWGWTRRLHNNIKHGYRCLALCLGEDSCITTTILK